MKEGTGELFYGALLTGIKKLAPSDIPLEASWICAAKKLPADRENSGFRMEPFYAAIYLCPTSVE